MTDELKPCPFCGGIARWCDSEPDEEGVMHECEQVVCDSCQISFSLTGYGHEGCETYAEAKVKMQAIVNARAIPPTHRVVSVEFLDHLREELEIYLDGEECFETLCAIIDNQAEECQK